MIVICLFPQKDLVSTIGESAALGVAGVVLWGNALYSMNRVSIYEYHTLPTIKSYVVFVPSSQPLTQVDIRTIDKSIKEGQNFNLNQAKRLGVGVIAGYPAVPPKNLTV